MLWAISWLSYSLSYVFAFWYATQMRIDNLIAINQILLLMSGLYLLSGTYEFISIKLRSWWWYTTVAGAIWIVLAVNYGLSIRMLTTPTYLFLGGVYLWTGRVIFYSNTFRGLGKYLTGLSFVFWGIYKLTLPFLGQESWLAPWGYLISWLAPWGFLISIIMTFSVAIGILLAFFNRISQDLQRSEERFRLLAENAHDMIYRLSMQPKKSIEYISPAVNLILGYSIREIIGNEKNMIKRVYRDDRKLIFRLLSHPETRTSILRWKHKDGNQVWIEYNSVPIYDAKTNQIIAIEGIARDITERKFAEQALQKSREKLVAAERMASLGTMAAGIAHEINQPLNSLKVTADSMLYLYKRERLIEMDEVMSSFIDISNQAKRIDLIIKNMRSLVRQNKDDNYELYSINSVIKSCVEMLSARLHSHNININMDLQENLPCVEAKIVQLEEVVINLIVNAMQALDKVDRNSKKIICKTYSEEAVCLDIIDNGPGVSDDIKDKLFDPFFTSKLHEDNMGLGLCIVDNIVKSHGGTIEFFNNEMGGTTVKLRFPKSNGLIERSVLQI
ncbi:MAG: PAS domain S-box protein [Tissierellales bacterium]|nr:PAS domain S-box protein [Tissierellales bacterium]MBN2827009.1 PAS domain S-box protein [Tissierellales bacterium]